MLIMNSLQEGTQVSSSLTALQAERDLLLRSAVEKDAELSSLRQLAQQQQSSMDLEKERLSRELEALRAQLQQQVPAAGVTPPHLEVRRIRKLLEAAGVCFVQVLKKKTSIFLSLF